MNCPKCGSGTRVIETRHLPENQVRRRRECLFCGSRFTTYEITQVTLARYEKMERAQIEKAKSRYKEVDIKKGEQK